MSPALLDVLLRQHRRANDPKAGRSRDDAPDVGSAADLLALQSMKVV